ncbi:MAG: gliding motility-associated C-terminal domain-containing protein [Bacteroidota bacterium]
MLFHFPSLADARLRYILVLSLIFCSINLRGQFALNGNAVSLGNDCFRLTQASNFQNGSVWYLNQVNVGQSFDLIFEVNLGCQDGNGADGIAFVLQQVSTNVGSAGGGLGYAGIQPSIAIELDTWQNNESNDPFTDHMAIMRNGTTNHNSFNNLAGPVNISAASGNVEDCNFHDFRVTWNADSLIMRVYFDCELRLTYNGNLIQSTFGNNTQVFWGFTGATGGFNNEQQFCLDFISFTEALRDTAICPNTTVQLDAGAGDTYQWSPATGLSDPQIRNPIAQPGTYTVEVVDACVERFDTVTISVRPPLSNVLPNQLILCPGDSVSINASTADATYLWADGSTDSILTVGQTGTYAVSIFGPCDTLIDSVQVITPADPLVSFQDVSCAGAADGSVQIFYNGMGPYIYSFFDNAGNIVGSFGSSSAQNNFNDFFPPGSYTLTILDGHHCIRVDSFTIQEPQPLQLQLQQQQNIPCGGAATGSISLLANGGTPNYQYSVGGAFQANANFNNLLAGTYQVIVRDANSCEDTISVTLTENPPLSALVDSIATVSCAGGNDGSVRLGGTGGLGSAYTYSLDGITYQAAIDFAGLSAGNYTAFVQDSVGCVSSVPFSISEAAPLIFSPILTDEIDCFGNANAAFFVQASGGVGPYQYALQNAPLTTDSSFSNLGAGTYLVTVEDANACVTTANFTISEPNLLQLATDNVQMVDCYQNATGSVDLGAIGGTNPYQYTLAGQAFGSSDLFGGLPAGNYLFVVQDTNLCLDSLTITISEPDSLAAAVINRVDVDCFGTPSGQLEVQGSGGTLPYQFSINNNPFQNTGLFTGLFAGFYNLAITDANGCDASVDTILTTPTGLAIGILQQQNIDCFGNNNGALSFQAVGGTAPYRYTTDGVNFTPLTQNLNNLPPGADTLFAYDANDCIVPIPYLITEPPAIAFQIDSLVNINCFGDSTGLIRLQANGGVTPYQFQLNGGGLQNDSLFTGLGAGIYQLIVQDDSACMATIDTVLTQSDLLVLQADSVVMVDCWGNNTGLVQLGIMGGVGPFQSQIDTFAFGNTLSYPNLVAGDYQFVVLDSFNCSDSISLSITQPDTLILSVQDNRSVLCFGDSTGSITLSTQGGTQPYLFQNNGGMSQADSLFELLSVGVYTFSITDSQGCIAQVIDSVAEPPLLEVIPLLTDVRCYEEGNGSIELQTTGGILPYAYSLDGSVPQGGNQYSPLVPGAYDIVVTDSNNCSVLLSSLLISQPDSLIVSLSGQDISCFAGSDGQIEANISGGNGGNTIVWNDPLLPASPNIDSLMAGTYLIEVSDSLGCVDTSSLTLTQPDTLVMAQGEIVEAFCDWENGAASVMSIGGTQPYVYEWSGLPNETSDQVIDVLGGDYLVRVIDQLGCEDTLSLVIPNTPPANALFTTLPDPNNPILQSQLPLQTLNQSEGAVAYLWDFGNGEGSELEAPLINFDDTGIYNVRLTAYNSFFVCPTEYSLAIEIIPDGIIFAPSAFTPNGDGSNDEFFFKGEGVPEMTAIIFDRWGAEIIRFNALDQTWDGRTANGRTVPEGVYVYRLLGTFNSGENFERSGTITLIR